MDREQAVKYLQSSGFSEEQIKAIEGAFTCDKCVYSTNEGCQYDDITETIPPFEDCISRKEAISIAGIATLSVNQVVAALKKLPPVNPQKSKFEYEHDHEILKAYSDGANAVLDIIKAEIESKYESIPDTFHHYETGFTDALEWVLSIIDKYKAEGSEA